MWFFFLPRSLQERSTQPRLCGPRSTRQLLLAIACCLCGTQCLAQSQIRLEPRTVVEKNLKSFAGNNRDREATIRKLFLESGCAKSSLTEQSAEPEIPPNIICVLPGKTNEVIVVGAHTDKVTNAGDGVVDNWTGASLLPSLLFSLSGETRRHTFVFVGFTAEEQGMVGSEYYAGHLTPQQRSRVQAMVNMDSLGLAPTKVWASHADKALLDALLSVAAIDKLPVAVSNIDNLGSTDSESFGNFHIPRITLHSVTPDTWRILHSNDDRLAAIKMDDYYGSYRLIAEYLADLDRALRPVPSSH